MRKNWLSSPCFRMRAFRARAEARSLPNGFSMTTRRKAPSVLLQQAGLPEGVDDRPEEAGRDREVEDHVARTAPGERLRRSRAAVKSPLTEVQAVADEAPGLRVDVVGVELGGRGPW